MQSGSRALHNSMQEKRRFPWASQPRPAQGQWGWNGAWGPQRWTLCFTVACSGWNARRGPKRGNGPGLQRHWVVNGVKHFVFLQAHLSPHNFTNNIRKALDILHAEVWKLVCAASVELHHVLLGPQSWCRGSTGFLPAFPGCQCWPCCCLEHTSVSGGRRGRRDQEVGGATWKTRSSIQQEGLAPDPDERLDPPALVLLGTDLAFPSSGSSGICEPGKSSGDHQPEGAVPGEEGQLPKADP